MTKTERLHVGRVAALGCVACRNAGLGPTPAQVHHIREEQGLAQRAGNFLVIPLCETHHTGALGIHADKRRFVASFGNELDLLNQVLGEVMQWQKAP